MDIDKRIAEAMKSHDEVALRTYRLIKTEFVNAIKNGVTIDNATEAKLLNKMITQHKDSIAFENIHYKLTSCSRAYVFCSK